MRRSQFGTQSVARHHSRAASPCARPPGAAAQDPEGIFKSAPQQGLIDRKLMGQRMQQDDEARKQVEAYEAKAREELQQKREVRQPPFERVLGLKPGPRRSVS